MSVLPLVHLNFFNNFVGYTLHRERYNAISACQRKRPLVLVTLFLDTNFVSDNVLQQALGEVDGLRFVMLEDKMPGLFDHYTEGHSICFWFRNIFPNMAVCFGAESDIGHHGELILNGSVYVKGELLESFIEERIYGRITSEHNFLVDLQSLIHEDKLNRVALEHQWNKIQIRCTLRSCVTEEIKHGQKQREYISTNRNPGWKIFDS
ncbi:hypothetical protein K1719_013651 [Acacia pycnantha]|nr:hypothetical protein K1719_013651 [Acacia pycnantha]